MAEDTPEEITRQWRDLLTGTGTSLAKIRSRNLRLPSDPRCKMCSAPFGAPGSIISRLLRHGQHRDNPLLCDWCYGTLRKHPGGAEVDVSVLFADVRGSTGLAEEVGAARFRALLQTFYAIAERAVSAEDGAIDKFMGDGVMALFIPGFTGLAHAAHAIAAGRRILDGIADAHGDRLPVGVGVHTGTTYVGVVGSGDDVDFSALGDVVNVAARLGSLAEAGQLLVSVQTVQAAGLRAEDLQPHVIEVRGRTEPVTVVELSPVRV
jgi:adenylate cyclase